MQPLLALGPYYLVVLDHASTGHPVGLDGAWAGPLYSEVLLRADHPSIAEAKPVRPEQGLREWFRINSAY